MSTSVLQQNMIICDAVSRNQALGQNCEKWCFRLFL